MPLLREPLGFTFAKIEVEPSAPSISEIVVTKVTDSSTPLFMEDDTFDFQPQLTTEPTEPTAPAGKDEPQQMYSQIMQQLTQGGPPDAFDFTTKPTAAAMGDFDNNGDVDGRDFLVWQRGNATPDSVPVGEDGGLSGDQLAVLLLPAVHDDGLLLPY